jgi:hypothetical protein
VPILLARLVREIHEAAWIAAVGLAHDGRDLPRREPAADAGELPPQRQLLDDAASARGLSRALAVAEPQCGAKAGEPRHALVSLGDWSFS